MKKKVLATLMTATLVLGMVGCGSSKAEEASTDDAVKKNRGRSPTDDATARRR